MRSELGSVLSSVGRRVRVEMVLSLSYMYGGIYQQSCLGLDFSL